jgi:hypothetical protein
MAVGRPSDVAWYEAPLPLLKVHRDTSLSRELAVRVQVFLYCAMTQRYSEAWTFITGTSLDIAAPTI